MMKFVSRSNPEKGEMGSLAVEEPQIFLMEVPMEEMEEMVVLLFLKLPKMKTPS
jgi:hypothetical protein